MDLGRLQDRDGLAIHQLSPGDESRNDQSQEQPCLTEKIVGKENISKVPEVILRILPEHEVEQIVPEVSYFFVRYVLTTTDLDEHG